MIHFYILHFQDIMKLSDSDIWKAQKLKRFQLSLRVLVYRPTFVQEIIFSMNNFEIQQLLLWFGASFRHWWWWSLLILFTFRFRLKYLVQDTNCNSIERKFRSISGKNFPLSNLKFLYMEGSSNQFALIFFVMVLVPFIDFTKNFFVDNLRNSNIRYTIGDQYQFLHYSSNHTVFYHENCMNSNFLYQSIF